MREARDKAAIAAGGMRTWEGKKVRCIVICFSCGKPRCIFSNENNADFENAMVAFQQKLESVSERYSCRDLIFPDNDPLSKLVVQRQNLNCESPIEKQYYNIKGRAYKTDDICYHCGEGCSKRIKGGLAFF